MYTLTHKVIKSETARKMYGLYRYYGGLRFTGVVSTTKQGIIDYLNRTYVCECIDDNGTIVSTHPSWDENAFCIQEIEIDLV